MQKLLISEGLDSSGALTLDIDGKSLRKIRVGQFRQGSVTFTLCWLLFLWLNIFACCAFGQDPFVPPSLPFLVESCCNPRLNS